MAPSEKQIIAALKSKVREIFHSTDRDDLTVKRVRDIVEKELGLEDGYLQNGALKEKSKATIKSFAQELLDKEDAEPVSSPPLQNAKKIAAHTKKATTAKKLVKPPVAPAKQPPRKRQKKAATPSEDEDEDVETSEPSDVSEEESQSSDFGETDASDAPRKQKKAVAKQRKPVKRGATKKIQPEFEDSEGNTKKRKRMSRPNQRLKAAEPTRSEESADSNDDKDQDDKLAATKDKEIASSKDDSKNEEQNSAENPSSEIEDALKSSFTKAPSPSITSKPTNVEPADESDSEMSMVLDGEPKPKTKRRSKNPSSPKSKTTTKIKSSKPSTNATKDLTPDELTIKTLQSQISKCGVRKIWQFELKQYEDDNKQKIKHLQGMLRDLGMTGRFSEGRAKEIKEMRELMADVEAVKEGEKSWGMESGRRSRPKKSLKEESDDEDDDEGDAEVKAAAKKGRSRSESEQPEARAERLPLDWLSDEEDSDD